MKTKVANSTSQNWPRVKLGELCNLVNGDAYRETDWSDEGVPIIRIQNLNNPNKPFNYWTGSIDDRVVVKPGDVLLAWSGTPGTSFGTHRWTRGIGILNQHIFRVDLDTTRIDPEWAVFSINEQLAEMIGRAHGAVGLRHVTKGECESLPILLPPLTEQRRIAARLREQMAEVERARAAVQAQLDAAQSLPAALLRAIFASPAAHRWPIHKLGDLLEDACNGLYKPDHFCGHGTPILKMFNIGRLNGQWDLMRVDKMEVTENEQKQFGLRVGDIMFNRVNSRELVGKCAVVDESTSGAVFESKIMRLRLKTNVADPVFVATFLNSHPGRLQIEKRTRQIIGMATVNRSDLNSFEIVLPSIQEQKKLVLRLDTELAAASSLAESLETRLAEIELLPAAVLREAFNGE